MKKILALLLVMVMVVSLFAGCGGQQAAPEPEAPPVVNQDTDSLSSEKTEGVAATADEGADKEIVVCIKQDPAPLSPFSGDRDVRVYVLNQCYQPLFRFDGYGGELDPCLGKSYKIIDDKTVEVEIFDNIYDAAGNHMTANDVKFSYEKALELGNYTRITDVEGVEVVSDYVAHIKYKTSTGLTAVLDNSLCSIFMVCQAAYEASPDELATLTCGTGRYEVETYNKGASVTVVKRDDYWQTDESQISKYDQANVGKIRYDVITDGAARAIGMQKGEIDFCAFVNTADYALFEDGGESADKFDILATNTPYLYCLTINCHPDSPMNNRNLRLAVTHAIDAKAVAQKAFGVAALNIEGNGSPSNVGYQEEWNSGTFYNGAGFNAYNPELAKEYLNKYLEETGTKLEDLVIRIYVGQMGGMDTMATMAQAYLSAIGVTVDAQVYDSATLGALKKDTAAWEMSAYTGYSNKYITEHWDAFFDARDYSHEGTMTYIIDDTLQKMVEDILLTENFTPEKLNEFNTYITDNAYLIPICGQLQRMVYPSFCVEPLTDARGIPMPGACTYDWSKAE